MNLLVRICACFILGAVVAACSNARVTTTPNDADTQAFMNATIPAIFAHFDTKALAQAGDPAVYDYARLEKARQNFASVAARMGTFLSYSGAHGSTEIVSVAGAPEVKHASYDAELVYQNGRVGVHIDANEAKGKWRVEYASMQPLPAH